MTELFSSPPREPSTVRPAEPVADADPTVDFVRAPEFMFGAKPGRREIRSARSAASIEVWEVEEGEGCTLDVKLCWPGNGYACGWVEPRWPSFMATVERADMEVVVELGVPLH